MNDLPWPDCSFDVVTSFNAIWAGGEEAAAEAARVLRPDGTFAMTFWGPPRRVGLLPPSATTTRRSGTV